MVILAFSCITSGFANESRQTIPSLTDSINQVFDKAKQGDANAQNQVGAWYYAGTNVKQDYSQAYEWWKKAALQGHVEGIGNLGLCYQFGRGIEKDSIDAMRLYMKSIKEGNKALLEERVKRANNKSTFDCVLVALCYQKGNGAKQNLNAAIDYFAKAAALNSVDAQRELALCYVNNKEPQKAAPWFKKAAEQDDAASAYYYGKMLLDGNGITADLQNAVIYLLKAAKQEFSQAQVEVGNMYETGKGVAKNEESAVQWYQNAAGHGNVHGAWNLALCYMKGSGIKRDYDQAMFWFTEASAGGYKRSFKKMMEENEEVKQSAFLHYLKGLKLYFTGKYDEAMKEFKVVEKAKVAEGITMQGVCYANNNYSKSNAKKAVKMLSSTCDAHPASAFYLASLYEHGKGVDKNMDKAIGLYTQSALAGYGTAQSYLGDIYYEGRGTTQDYTKAVEYYTKAYNQRQLTLNSTKRLASCYENGWGVPVDKAKADALKKEKNNKSVNNLLEMIE